MKQTLPIIVITGATASGKTEIAIKVAKKIGAEIICADSRIVYKDFNIVSAKPDIEERRGVIHHLVDIKNPDEGVYSAGDFVKDASQIIEKTDRPIIIQGGTWFYIKSLLDEKMLIEFGKNEELRKSLESFSNEQLWHILYKKDEKRAISVHKNNRSKIIRSLELIDAIKGKISQYERKENKKYKAKWYIKEYDREALYQRIDKRVDLMVKKGLYDEWLQNKQKYHDAEILLNTIGYREFFELENKVWENFEIAVDKIKQRTRNFAKRQLSWFRQNRENFSIRPVEEIL